jgi:hypothetical protein
MAQRGEPVLIDAQKARGSPEVQEENQEEEQRHDPCEDVTVKQFEPEELLQTQLNVPPEIHDEVGENQPEAQYQCGQTREGQDDNQ